MTDTEDNAPNPLDIALGSRIRLRRRELGLSQEQLAKQIGITFQQVQKYEHGANRVSFSRLMEICQALKCGVIDLIDNIDGSRGDGMFVKYASLLNEPGAVDLLTAFTGIASAKQRRAVLALAKQLSSAPGAEGETA